MSNKFRYLGVMVGEYSSRIKAWDDVILKLRSRLSKWKVKTLSIGGRLTLLKSVLGASPIYNMSIFKVPTGMIRDSGSDCWYRDVPLRVKFPPLFANGPKQRTSVAVKLCFPIDISFVEMLGCSVCEEDVSPHLRSVGDLAQLVLRRICRWWER
ncbi:hypothetical protein Tco_0390746 [Tanacetum coccineum]